MPIIALLVAEYDKAPTSPMDEDNEVELEENTSFLTDPFSGKGPNDGDAGGVDGELNETDSTTLFK